MFKGKTRVGEVVIARQTIIKSSMTKEGLEKDCYTYVITLDNNINESKDEKIKNILNSLKKLRASLKKSGIGKLNVGLAVKEDLRRHARNRLEFSMQDMDVELRHINYNKKEE